MSTKPITEIERDASLHAWEVIAGIEDESSHVAVTIHFVDGGVTIISQGVPGHPFSSRVAYDPNGQPVPVPDLWYHE